MNMAVGQNIRPFAKTFGRWPKHMMSTKVPIDSGKDEAEQAIPLPLILENITQTIRFPHDSMDEAFFLGELVDTCNCGLSLDVTNLYINSVNYGFDPCHRYPAQNVSSSE